jgi:GABA permease
MGLTDETRSQLLLSLLSWGVVLVLYAVTRSRGGSISAEEIAAEGRAEKVLVLANRTLGAADLHRALHRLEAGEAAEYVLVVPDATEGAADRLEEAMAELREQGLTVTGELGDPRALVALDRAIRRLHPDRIVISTQPEGSSTWLRQGVVDQARQRYAVAVEHVLVERLVAAP